jgi:hypothetical protein
MVLTGKMRNASTILVKKFVEKTPFRRSKSRWKNNINYTINKEDMRMPVGLIWLKAGASGEFF